MKIALFDLENQIAPPLLEEALDLVKETNEYDLTEPEAGYYHCISKQPDYHVELTHKTDGTVSAKCHCTIFRRAKQCKHAVAAMLLLREQLLRSRRGRSKSKQENAMLEEVLKKLSITQLRGFITDFGHSHSAFRAEILANFLHLVRKPDYHHLLMDMTPMDKYGNFKLNRNNLKTVRNIIATLLKQAQQLIREKGYAEAFQILEASLHHLYRLMIKVPQFQEQLTTELRLALRLFETLCHQSMAPRLQSASITLAMEISSREGYTFLKGTTPLLLSVESFILEEKARQAAFQLAEKKTLSDPRQSISWATLVLRWKRKWSMNISGKVLKNTIDSKMPDIVQEFNRLLAYEDVIQCVKDLQIDQYDKHLYKSMLQAGLRSARNTGDKEMVAKLANELSLIFLDVDAWDTLLEVDSKNAERVLKLISEYYVGGADAHADQILLYGFSTMAKKQELFERLAAIGEMSLWMQYDSELIASERDGLISVYAKHIHAMREAYGGVMARQKLSNIFSHLKSIDLFTAVAERLKNMDQKHTADVNNHTNEILGFVFDLDGVIVDTAVHHFQSWKKVLKQLGAEITEEDDHHTRGASRMESLEYLINQYGIQLTQEEKEMWAARKNEIYLEAIQEITPRDLLPGALAFLIDTRKSGLKLALGSASKNARGVLDKLGIADRFDAILDGNDAKESKPNPEIFTKACAALGLEPSTVVVFEDAAKGVQAALSAGCKAVGLGDPIALKEADLVITGLDAANPSSIIEQLS
ncbi:MAG TPA: beta-phosphoglucomutase [Saprospiraceae bacterium]